MPMLLSVPSSRFQIADAVVRLMLTSVWFHSGLFRYAHDTCVARSRVGLTESRAEYESGIHRLMSQRFWSGSRPQKYEPSSLNSFVNTPAVATPNVMCV